MAGLEPGRPDPMREGILLLDAATARPKALIPTPDTATLLAASPDGKTVACAFAGEEDPILLFGLKAAVPIPAKK
jgi:hypothetical protein